MAEEANRARRLQAFEETAQELARLQDHRPAALAASDLKSRLDAIEGDKSTFIGLTYKSFEAIDRKLAELSALQAQVEQAEAQRAPLRDAVRRVPLGVAAIALRTSL